MSSHLAYWQEYCKIIGTYPDLCLTEDTTPQAEAELIASFLVFVVHFPRKRKSQNTAAYTTQVLAAVRTYNADRIGRRPGIGANDKARPYVRAVIRGLRQIARAQLTKRRPLMAQHMRSVRDTFDLQELRHRVL